MNNSITEIARFITSSFEGNDENVDQKWRYLRVYGATSLSGKSKNRAPGSAFCNSIHFLFGYDQCTAYH